MNEEEVQGGQEVVEETEAVDEAPAEVAEEIAEEEETEEAA